MSSMMKKGEGGEETREDLLFALHEREQPQGLA